MIENDWDVDSIVVWNKSRFYDNSLHKQFKKLEGEIAEFNKAISQDHKMEELADVYIASAGLSRFSPVGKFICAILNELEPQQRLHTEINKKMRINIKRKFDKNMQHITSVKEIIADKDDADDDCLKPFNGEAEYLTFSKDAHIWKKENDEWKRTAEKIEFTVRKGQI